MSQTRKKKVLEDIRKRRQRRAVVSISLVVVLIAVIAGSIYFLARTGGNSSSGFLFPCLGTEGTAFHIHPWLRIWIDNVNVTIPAAVGIRNPAFTNGIAGGGPNSCFEPLHTHDSSGIIHIESPDTTTRYTLADFFTVWSETYSTATVNGANQPIVFNRTDILGYKIDSTHTLSLLIDEGFPTYQNSTQYEHLVLNPYDYCSAKIGSVPPCSPTAPGDPYPLSYPYGTNHTIVIYYK